MRVTMTMKDLVWPRGTRRSSSTGSTTDLSVFDGTTLMGCPQFPQAIGVGVLRAFLFLSATYHTEHKFPRRSGSFGSAPGRNDKP